MKAGTLNQVCVYGIVHVTWFVLYGYSNIFLIALVWTAVFLCVKNKTSFHQFFCPSLFVSSIMYPREKPSVE